MDRLARSPSSMTIFRGLPPLGTTAHGTGRWGGDVLDVLRSRLIPGGVLDFVQPDLALCGGISEGLRIAALADAFDVPVVPHVWGTAINFNASLHLTSVLPTKRGRLQYPLFERPLLQPLPDSFRGAPSDRRRDIAVPSGPGLGLDITPERIAPFVSPTLGRSDRLNCRLGL